MSMTRTLLRALPLALAAWVAAAGCQRPDILFARRPEVTHFDADKVGAVAAGWTSATGAWTVVGDDSAPSKPNVLAQTAAGANPDFNVALADAPRVADVGLSVRLKAVSGKLDQGGGPVWRAADAKNYYVCRWNPLENNYRLYKVIDGKRTQIASVDLKADAGWHTVGAVMKGEAIECSFDGKKVLEVKDEALKAAGRVGLWTKADAVTHFDDFSVTGR